MPSRRSRTPGASPAPRSGRPSLQQEPGRPEERHTLPASRVREWAAGRKDTEPHPRSSRASGPRHADAPRSRRSSAGLAPGPGPSDRLQPPPADPHPRVHSPGPRRLSVAPPSALCPGRSPHPRPAAQRVLRPFGSSVRPRPGPPHSRGEGAAEPASGARERGRGPRIRRRRRSRRLRAARGEAAGGRGGSRSSPAAPPQRRPGSAATGPGAPPTAACPTVAAGPCGLGLGHGGQSDWPRPPRSRQRRRAPAPHPAGGARYLLQVLVDGDVRHGRSLRRKWAGPRARPRPPHFRLEVRPFPRASLPAFPARGFRRERVRRSVRPGPAWRRARAEEGRALRCDSPPSLRGDAPFAPLGSSAHPSPRPLTGPAPRRRLPSTVAGAPRSAAARGGVGVRPGPGSRRAGGAAVGRPGRRGREARPPARPGRRDGAGRALLPGRRHGRRDPQEGRPVGARRTHQRPHEARVPRRGRRGLQARRRRLQETSHQEFPRWVRGGRPGAGGAGSAGPGRRGLRGGGGGPRGGDSGRRKYRPGRAGVAGAGGGPGEV